MLHRLGIRRRLSVPRVEGAPQRRRKVDPIASKGSVAYFGDWLEITGAGAAITDIAREGVTDLDPNVDNYPNLYDVLLVLQQHEDVPNEAVERVEITTLANGEANCRWWTPKAEEPEGIHIPQV